MSRRNLRLASGLVLFTYVASHFIDHALGLVSIALADRVLRQSLLAWHSLPGTLVLYGAAAVHVALALLAVYERRTLRMPPMQALRIAMGFAMPLMVIGHVVGTRMAAELQALAPTYERIVWALWVSGGEGRQLALLAPGWLHGCLGLDFAFGRRVAWQRLRPVLAAAALLLPVLAGLGFLSMSRELAALAVAPGWRPAAVAADTTQLIALGRLRDGLLAGYFTLIGLVLVGRMVRAQLDRARRRVVTIAYPLRTIEVPRGWTVLEASRGFGIAHQSMCGGQARCSTCRVRVVQGAEHCPAPSGNELRTLTRIHAAPDIRLACQLRPVGDISVVPVLAPDAQGPAGREAHGPTVERDLALLSIKLLGWRGQSGLPGSAHDVVHALNRLLAVVGDAVAAAGGTCGRLDNEGGMAMFGLTGDARAASRQALAVAADIEQRLVALNARLLDELGFTAGWTMALHAGPAAVGPVGYGRERVMSPVGQTVLAVRALRESAAQTGWGFALSRDAAAAAGVAGETIAWQAMPVAGAAMPLAFAGAASVAALQGILPGGPGGLADDGVAGRH